MRLFAYGVLNRELAKGRAAELIAPLDEGRPATVRGTLYALRGGGDGWYPILLPGEDAGQVHGMLHDASGVDWSAMDAFEDAQGRPDDEYARRELAVTLTDGTTTSAFAYCYVRDLPGDAKAIPGGNFGAWLLETGRAPISGRD
tara:strand:+ start:522 stop:953 length:432 start_codon:yes stop_codon:yes gene_type:complete